MHWSPNLSAASATKCRILQPRPELMDTLSAPTEEEFPDVGNVRKPSADCERHETVFRRSCDHVEVGVTILR